MQIYDIILKKHHLSKKYSSDFVLVVICVTFVGVNTFKMSAVAVKLLHFDSSCSYKPEKR